MADADVTELTEAAFDELVANSDLPVLVDFGAEWCMHCRLLEPGIREIAAEYAGRVVVAVVDMDREKGLEARLAIRLFPTVVIFAGGKADVVNALTGVLDAS